MLGASRSIIATPGGELGDDDEEEPKEKKESNPMDKIDADDKVMEEEKKDPYIQDTTPSP